MDENSTAGDDGDLTSGPLIKRVEDKRWKCRAIAFEELATQLSQAQPEDKIYEEYGMDMHALPCSLPIRL